MKKLIALIVILNLSILASGCAMDTQNAPCGDFGTWCHKTPVNSWNYKN